MLPLALDCVPAIDPDADNLRARRAYEKAGFHGDAVVESGEGPAIVMIFAERTNDILRQVARRRQLLEPFDDSFDRALPRIEFLDPVGMTLATTGVGKAESADHRG